MPVLRCSYCGKNYKVSNARYELAINGIVKNPCCSRACAGRIKSLSASEQRTDELNLKGLGIKEMIDVR